jgi:DNA-binding PadR family transcriptional regulator
MPSSIRLTYPTAIVLLAVTRGFRHGFDIIDASGLKSGTVYPILRRLEEAGSTRPRGQS